MATNDLRSQAHEYQALLLRPDRSLLACIVAVALIAVALQFGPRSGPAIGCYVIVLFGILRHVATRGRCWHEPVSFVLDETGLELVRRRQSQRAPWSSFEQIQIATASGRATHLSEQTWRITLVNAFKPSIGSFLHTSASEQTIFHFPLTLEFSAPQQQVQRLKELAERNIQIAQTPGSRTIVSHQQVDIESVLQLHACMACDYSLTGLPRSGRCPECGWCYDEHMFLVPGEWAANRSAAAYVVGAIIATFTFARIISLGWVWFFAILIVLAGLVWLPVVWKRSAMGYRMTLRILVTHDGIELWRLGAALRRYPWRELAEQRVAREDIGRLRLGMWREPKWRISYSRFFDNWNVLPPGPPAVDVLIDGTPDIAKAIIAEIDRRRLRHSAAPPTYPESDLAMTMLRK